LGAIFGAKPSSAPQPPAQYGVVPRNLPPEFRLPPPRVSDWQRPESDFGIDSPDVRAQIGRALAGGLPADQIVIGNPTARSRRDMARLADFLLPGSGNFASGDLDNITDKDIVRLALSTGLTVASGLMGLEAPAGSLVARASFEGESGAAGTAARAAAARGALGPAAALKGASPRAPEIPFELGPTQPVAGTGTSSQGAGQVFAPRMVGPADAGPRASVDLDGLELKALERRAHEIHSALKHDIERTHRTTAVLSTNEGSIVAGGTRDLTQQQHSLLREYEHPAMLPREDAEITALVEAWNRGWRPRAIATTREVCPECRNFIESLGGIRKSPTTYIFPR